MKVLNLANMQRGDIPYEVVAFSDGQKLINLGGKYAKGATNIEESVKIISRMSWEDLQLIMCANKALREAGFKYVHLYTPYFLGARSDRKFQDGSINYLKDIICPLINAQGFDSVTVLDPHSNCVEMGLQRFKKISNSEFVEWALVDLMDKHKEFVWLIPDKGATDKAYATMKEIGYTGQFVECHKERDVKTGKIIKTSIPHVIFDGDICVIVDDICDGGGTFIELAKVARKQGASKVYLVVTHGIFSKQYLEIFKYIDGVYTTNSVLKTVPSEYFPIKQLQVI